MCPPCSFGHSLYVIRASNAKETVVGATATARDTVARETQATVSDVQGLSASAQQAMNDSNGHPLAKYHSVGNSSSLWIPLLMIFSVWHAYLAISACQCNLPFPHCFRYPSISIRQLFSIRLPYAMGQLRVNCYHRSCIQISYWKRYRQVIAFSWPHSNISSVAWNHAHTIKSTRVRLTPSLVKSPMSPTFSSSNSNDFSSLRRLPIQQWLSSSPSLPTNSSVTSHSGV